MELKNYGTKNPGERKGPDALKKRCTKTGDSIERTEAGNQKSRLTACGKPGWHKKPWVSRPEVFDVSWGN